MSSAQTDRLLDKLERVRGTGPGRWSARCPAHKDRSPSLSIREVDDGRILLHCFSGCGVDAIVAALGMSMEDLFPPRPAVAEGRPREQRPFSTRQLLDALAAELRIVWVVLADVASGRELSKRDRERAALARERCLALIEELRLVR